MKNTHVAKTLTASLPGNPQTIFAFIADSENLSSWFSSFCRSLRRENGSLLVESPRGAVPVRFVRNDHSLVLDIVVQPAEGIELTHAIRLLSNGEGAEMVWTLVKPLGLLDSVFHEQLRWAGSALNALRKTPQKPLPPEEGKVDPPPQSSPIRGEEVDSQPLQAPSPAEVSSMPLSGKKLFIGNLPYDWSDDQLRAHFAEQGAVTLAEVARFRGRGGRSRGFGFVEMTTENEAQTAIEKCHGGLAGGRQIIVRLAKSQESRPPRGNGIAPDVAVSSEPVEPGNERVPRAPIQRSRSERPSRRGGRSRPERSPRMTGAAGAYPRRIPGRQPGAQPYQEQDISNKSGYEIFPRRAAGSSEPNHTSAPEPSSSRPPRDASPYMDDTGDIENHGHRPPRPRRPGSSR
jgi:cold-inducible RNA-binding protein